MNLDDVRAHLVQREQARTGALERRRVRFEASLPAAAALLRERFSATRVIAFGSVITGDLSGQVDVDLAVDGLPGKYQFEAQAALMALFSAPVDLVMLEQAPEFLRERIEAEGHRL